MGHVFCAVIIEQVMEGMALMRKWSFYNTGLPFTFLLIIGTK